MRLENMFPAPVLPFIEWAQGRPLTAVCLLALVAAISLAVQRVIYRLWFHPLAAFPGPKAAAATTQWKAYLEVVLNKSFYHVLQELHAKYGTIWFTLSGIKRTDPTIHQATRSALDQMR